MLSMINSFDAILQMVVCILLFFAKQNLISFVLLPLTCLQVQYNNYNDSATFFKQQHELGQIYPRCAF